MSYLSAVALFLALGALLRADPTNLARTEPVPTQVEIPIADFFRAPVLSNPEINRAGTFVSALVSVQDKTGLAIWDVARKHWNFSQAFGDTDVASAHWLDDQHVLFNLMSEKYFNFASMVAPAANLHDSYPLFQYANSELIGSPETDRGHPLFWLRSEPVAVGGEVDYRPGSVVTADAMRETATQIINPDQVGSSWQNAKELVRGNEAHVLHRFPPVPGIAVGYLPDLEGNLAYGLAADDLGARIMYRFESGEWMRCPIDLDRVQVITYGDQPGQLVVLGPREIGRARALQFMDAATGRLGDALVRDAEYDFDGQVFRDAARGQIVGAQFDRQGPTSVWFTAGYRELQHVLDAFFKGKKVSVLSTDKAATVALVAVFSDREPATYYLVNVEQRNVTLLRKSRPWIDPSRMSPMNVFRFRTRDGIALDAYLTLPPSASAAHPVPLIVYPHGGPFYRDTWGFRSDVQYLASRGYAVLQPNYRNSVGYQWRAAEGDVWNFGRMSDDVSDAARAAFTTGLLDRRRVAIVGASFGGYLAISGAAHDPALYRCAVSIAGVCDWVRMLKAAREDEGGQSAYVQLRRYLGDLTRNHARLEAMSPINYVAQIRIPVFVYHGDDDHNVPVEQSHELASALDRCRIPHQVMFVSREGHGPRHINNEVAMWQKIETFLSENLALRN